ncbi:MAG: universal stress protein [Planctomycetales bacterium]|nr:universal stress protein [Planctomycetales bacterium]
MSWLPRKRIIVPFDFSDESFAAVRLARSFVEDAGALHVVHVLPELTATEPGVIWATIDDTSRMNHAREAMEERLKDVPGIEINVGFGDPGHVITDLAQEIGADLIVIPSHGRTGVKRLLLGSVAERVVRMAHCPVLVLRQ